MVLVYQFHGHARNRRQCHTTAQTVVVISLDSLRMEGLLALTLWGTIELPNTPLAENIAKRNKFILEIVSKSRMRLLSPCTVKYVRNIFGCVIDFWSLFSRKPYHGGHCAQMRPAERKKRVVTLTKDNGVSCLGCSEAGQEHTGRCRAKCQSQRGGGFFCVAERLVNWDRHNRGLANNTEHAHVSGLEWTQVVSVLCVACFLAGCVIAPTACQSCNVFRRRREEAMRKLFFPQCVF